jgi:hypothetical protein
VTQAKLRLHFFQVKTDIIVLTRRSQILVSRLTPQSHFQAIAAEPRHTICLSGGWGLPISPDVSSNLCDAKTQIPELRLFQSQHALAVGTHAEHVG